MSLLGTFADFCDGDDGDAAERAVFEASMVKKINKDGYKMADLLFELYQCQKRITILERRALAEEELSQTNAKPRKK